MLQGINMGKTNGCSNVPESVTERVLKRARQDGRQK